MRMPATSSPFCLRVDRSRTWPTLASTRKLGPRYLLIVFALAGDSTINRSKPPRPPGAPSPLPPGVPRLRRADAGSTPVAASAGAARLRVGFFASVEGRLAGFLRGVGTDRDSVIGSARTGE